MHSHAGPTPSNKQQQQQQQPPCDTGLARPRQALLHAQIGNDGPRAHFRDSLLSYLRANHDARKEANPDLRWATTSSPQQQEQPSSHPLSSTQLLVGEAEQLLVSPPPPPAQPRYYCTDLTNSLERRTRSTRSRRTAAASQGRATAGSRPRASHPRRRRSSTGCARSLSLRRRSTPNRGRSGPWISCASGRRSTMREARASTPSRPRPGARRPSVWRESSLTSTETSPHTTSSPHPPHRSTSCTSRTRCSSSIPL